MHNRSICLVERVEAMTRAHRYDWPQTLIDRTEPFRRQVLLTEYLFCLEITFQVLLNGFRRLYGWGRLSSSPEVNSLIVSACQVSFSSFFFPPNYHPNLKLALWKHLEPSSGVRINSTYALTTIGRKRKQGLIRCAGTRIRRWWQTGR